MTREELERELHIHQLQIRSLLTITQAINDNVSASGLFEMYKNFLAWEMEVKKMALFSQEQDAKWKCVAAIDVNFNIDKPEVITNLLKYNRLHTINPSDHAIVREFDILIPVYHKNIPISYALIGGFKEEKDIYNKIQFITTITNIISVAIENKRLFNRQIQQQRLQKEFELAAEVQQMFIPDHLPTKRRYNISSIYRPHFNVGGDYYDYISISEEEFYLCIADISGKGVGAAILMANFQAILKVTIRRAKKLTEIVEQVNHAIYELTKSDKFITFFIAKVNLRKQEIEYVNAGHNPPIFLEDNRIEELAKGTTVLGAVEQLPFVEVGRIRFQRQSLFVTYTDGLTDLQNEDGIYFDRSQLIDFLCAHADCPAKELNYKLQQELERFKGTKEYPDDIAILSCQFTPETKVIAATINR